MKKLAIISLLVLLPFGLFAYSMSTTYEAVEQLGYLDKQLRAIMTDVELWLGWGFEEKDLGKKVMESALKDLSDLKKEISAFEVTGELTSIKDLELGAINRLEKIYSDIYKKDEKQIGEEFKTFHEFSKKYLVDFEAAVKKYARQPKFPKDFNPISEELALAGSSQDKEAYQKAIDKMQQRKFKDAALLLKDLLSKYHETAFGDCIKVRLSDCWLNEDNDSKDIFTTEEQDKGVKFLKDIIDSNRYSPVLYNTFLRWRTKEQEMNHGMSNMSDIPNKEYNKKRWLLVQVIRRYLKSNPSDKWAMNQINLLISIPNIERGGTYGNYNLNYYGMLYMDLEKEEKKPSAESRFKKVVDSQGNAYEVAENGDIYSEGAPKPGRQPASVENIDYYFNESLQLEVNGHIPEAFTMYAEILSLPEANESVKTLQRGIRLRIERLYNSDGQMKKKLLMYFDIKELKDGSLKINPKSNPK
ncbi:MAG: hypothetical protein WCI77_06960 [Candidatus Omnitrophota bacterium]